jgi:hypothetical protein
MAKNELVWEQMFASRGPGSRVTFLRTSCAGSKTLRIIFFIIGAGYTGGNIRNRELNKFTWARDMAPGGHSAYF